jgi:uncharacterized membrane protein
MVEDRSPRPLALCPPPPMPPSTPVTDAVTMTVYVTVPGSVDAVPYAAGVGNDDVRASSRWQRWGDRLFRLALVVKGIDGALELLGGLALLAVPATLVSHWAHVVVQDIWSQDPHDRIAVWLVGGADKLANDASMRGFGTIYLLGHGVIKLLLVWALLKRVYWAYPVGIGVLLAFIGFEVYRYTNTHSVSLLVFAGLDVVITLLVAREYRTMRGARRAVGASAGTAHPARLPMSELDGA